MSFVSIVISDKLVSAMADKRNNFISYPTNKIYYGVGMAKKLYRVGEYGFYAATGNVTLIKSFITKSGFINNFLQNGVLKNDQEIELWFNENLYLLNPKPLESEPIDSFHIYFGGISEDNHVCAFTMSNKKSRLNIGRAEEGCYTYALSDSSHNAEGKFGTLMRSFDGTIKSAQKIQSEMNKWVSSWNPGVSVEVDSFALDITQ